MQREITREKFATSVTVSKKKEKMMNDVHDFSKLLLRWKATPKISYFML